MKKLLLLSLLLVAQNEAHSASPPPSCLSHKEAKATYRGAYLYWHRGPSGARCWSDRRRQSSVVKVAPNAVRTELAEGPLMIPPEIVPTLPKPEVDPPMKWEWEPMARYTTFEGEEPDTWPKLEDNSRHFEWFAGFIAAILVFWLWRRYERRKINVVN